jgi:integrase
MIEFSHGNVHRRDWEHAGKKRSAYEYSFTYTKDGVTRRARGQATTRAEALEAMEARKVELDREPEPVAAPAITLDEYADKWLVNIAPSIEKRTHQSYSGLLKNHIRPALGALPLAAITRAQVKELLASKRAAGMAKDSVRLIRATISALFAEAQDAELVEANPAARTGRARGRKMPDTISAHERRQKIRAMTVEQLSVFLEAAAGDRHGLLYLTLADTGMRPGEVFALRWTDIDLAGHQVTVERAVERGGNVKSTKTGASRVVDLTPRLAAALDRQQTAVEAAALAAGRDVNPLVFPSDAGTPLDGINVARRFQGLITRAGLPRFRLYDLRHTFASHLLALGAPITYVADQLGHSKPTMTLAAYAHWLPRGDRALADRLEALRAGVQLLKTPDAAHGPQGTPQRKLLD